MKHLLNGVAIAAVLAIAAPVWAQNPPGGTPPAPAPGATPPPATTSAMPPAHHAVKHTRAMHSFHKGMGQRAHMAGDTTSALNRQELARIQSGQPPVPPSAPMGEGPPGSPQPPPSR
jgi:hypothetical protein